MKERFQVSAGMVRQETRHFDAEEGEYFYRYENVWLVSFSTKYGIEYTHRHAFPETAQAAAERLARRVEDRLNTVGLDKALDLTHWGDRVIYGSQAYIDEEPYIVAREKSDDLMSEFFGG